MDDETRKIAMLIAAFEEEHGRLQNALRVLGRSGAQLQQEVRGAARDAVDAALKDLQPQVQQARRTLVDLQRFSIWRAAWQHVLGAAVAVVITLLGVWWYVPPASEIGALRAEREQLQAAIDTLEKRGGRIALNTCGPQKRLCVLVDQTAGRFGNNANKDDVYMVAKGY